MNKPLSQWRPETMPALVISRLGKLLMKRMDDSLKSVGVTTAQLPVLVALKNGERLTQKALAEFADVEQPSMAQLLARMERDNLIQREPSPTDGRSSLIALTDHAHGLLEPGRDALRLLDAEICADLTPEEHATLSTLLARVAARIEKTAD
ncbi:MarR family winged helix-turn-helix transcriptional regulator [Brevundimonas nasdae]|uniref:MarR family winged helix-turn-helix transcriptional regulator n=1 Tax=Brevundimonas nasdae TaxID=172043 RepID=UPI0028A08C29|nr:MarR family transcriptional regulator [Brevundimonas nasdae]